MNETTSKLIEQLAKQLGTTSQYLWEVLLKQAHIEATTNLIFVIFVVFFGISLYKIHKRLLRKPKEEKYKSYYDKYEEAAIVPIILGLVALMIMIPFVLILIPSIINGYLNPEYWALNQVMQFVN